MSLDESSNDIRDFSNVYAIMAMTSKMGVDHLYFDEESAVTPPLWLAHGFDADTAVIGDRSDAESATAAELSPFRHPEGGAASETTASCLVRGQLSEYWLPPSSA